MTTATTMDQAMRLADQQSNLIGLTHYVVRTANEDLQVCSFEEYTFELHSNGHIIYEGEWQ